MRRSILLAAIFLAGPVQQSAAPPSASLGERIHDLLSKNTVVTRGNFGFKVVLTESGEVLAQQNSDRFFTPASNTKLYTTAAALARLGPNYRSQTEVRTSSVWTPGQTAVKDLSLVGAGDPNLSGRLVPYQVDAKDGDPLAAINELAGKLAAAGIREVDGDIWGVSTRYSGDRYPDGWTLDDAMYDYGAPVSALALNDNAVSLTLTPSSEGELATVEIKPKLSHLLVNNRVLSVGSGTTDVHVSRVPATNELTLWGTLASKGAGASWQQDIAIEDPALFAAEALRIALLERGIAVHGEARAVYADAGATGDVPFHSGVPPSGTVLAVHESAPLWQAVQVVNKVSQNLHAEMLLRELGFVMAGAGTLEAGVAARQTFLAEAGVKPDESGFVLADGSGLARQDLTTPNSTVALLRFMWQRPERDLWLASLPIGGVDGSLEHRFKNIAGAERVHAKTGSIAHVNTLSGYIETKDHQWLAFSAMVNATNGHSSEVVQFLDRFAVCFWSKRVNGSERAFPLFRHLQKFADGVPISSGPGVFTIFSITAPVSFDRPEPLG